MKNAGTPAWVKYQWSEFAAGPRGLISFSNFFFALIDFNRSNSLGNKVELTTVIPSSPLPIISRLSIKRRSSNGKGGCKLMYFDPSKPISSPAKATNNTLYFNGFARSCSAKYSNIAVPLALSFAPGK